MSVLDKLKEVIEKDGNILDFISKIGKDRIVNLSDNEQKEINYREQKKERKI